MLYFIKSGKYVKIGYSQDFNSLVKRMKNYCTHNPNIILMSFTEFGSQDDETYLHNRCSNYNYYTEWFEDNEEVYYIWEETVKEKNLIPKNCFFNFPKDLQEFSNLDYRQSWDKLDTFKFEDGKEEIFNELNEITLSKYFGRKQKTFTKEDFVRACGFAGKELNIKVDKGLLKKFGYEIAGNVGMITVFKLEDVFFD